jgi:hypothetical protein
MSTRPGRGGTFDACIDVGSGHRGTVRCCSLGEPACTRAGAGNIRLTTHSKTIAFITKIRACRGHHISKLLSAGGRNWWHTIALAFGMRTLLTGVQSRAAKLVPQSPPSPLQLCSTLTCAGVAKQPVNLKHRASLGTRRRGLRGLPLGKVVS